MSGNSLLDKLRGARGQTFAPIPDNLSPEDRRQALLQRIPMNARVELMKKPIQRRMEAYITEHGPSAAMLRRANICAFRSEPVLIQGESGTGKEIVAKILLANALADTFFPVNCAGLVDTLFEALVFGHIAGTFTGASQSKPGILVSAGTGTVFFDEIGELPLLQQAKLLRALQERQVLPVGANVEVPVRCRFIFATNRDLEKLVETGQFREDLYQRIAALTLTTYPLRERPSDAHLIADHYCMEKGWEMPEIVIPDRVIQSKGNIRTLQNWLLRINVFGEDEN